jgi:hypothetical protein
MADVLRPLLARGGPRGQPPPAGPARPGRVPRAGEARPEPRGVARPPARGQPWQAVYSTRGPPRHLGPGRRIAAPLDGVCLAEPARRPPGVGPGAGLAQHARPAGSRRVCAPRAAPRPGGCGVWAAPGYGATSGGACRRHGTAPAGGQAPAAARAGLACCCGGGWKLLSMIVSDETSPVITTDTRGLRPVVSLSRTEPWPCRWN